MNILVTGAAGFIGAFTCKALIEAGHQVVGLDNLNDYYTPSLKRSRLAMIQEAAELAETISTDATLANSENSIGEPCWKFVQGCIEDRSLVFSLFEGGSFDRVIHLAAQAGVRYSLENPFAYSTSNLEGFLVILEACRQYAVPHLLYASSSSVYGANTKVPFSEEDRVDSPVSLYAATKRANELMAHSYAHLYGMRLTGMRFFTVYGPMGRPDMAYFKFAQKMRKGEPIEVYNHGELMRDFTYIDDVVKAIMMIAEDNHQGGGQGRTQGRTQGAGTHRIYNIGNENPEKLEYFISTLEDCLGMKAEKKYLPMQAGDVYTTSADTSALFRDYDWKPSTPLKVGLQKFSEWYKAQEDF